MHFSQSIFGIIALSLGLATPLNDNPNIIERQNVVNCGNKGVLSQSDANAAFQDAVNAATPGSCWGVNSQYLTIDGHHSAIFESGDVQFYVCNNADSTRCFTLDSNVLSTENGAFSVCNYNNFFISQSDDWSSGFDIAGSAECGGF